MTHCDVRHLLFGSQLGIFYDNYHISVHVPPRFAFLIMISINSLANDVISKYINLDYTQFYNTNVIVYTTTKI